jgi:S-adenosylmethionine synthetase
VARPVSVMVDTRGTGVVPDAKIEEIVCKLFDFRPSRIISYLGLLSPIYRQVAAYGHFGRDDLDLPWERLDMTEKIKNCL